MNEYKLKYKVENITVKDVKRGDLVVYAPKNKSIKDFEHDLNNETITSNGFRGTFQDVQLITETYNQEKDSKEVADIPLCRIITYVEQLDG